MPVITSSLLSGTPWFASLYNGYGPVNNSSSSQPGLPPSTDGLPNIYQIGYPFEIYSIKYNNTAPSPTFSASYGYWDIILKNTSPNLFSNLTGSNPIPIGGVNYPVTYYGLGLILMSGNPSSNFIPSYIPTPSGSWNRFSSIGPGYITTQYPKSQITQNANHITKTYGNNPNP